MLTKLLVLLILTAGVTGLPLISHGQERDRIPTALKPYFEPETISRLEWRLMNFNISWQGAFTGPVGAEYITSFPIWFDYRKMRFAANFRASEKKDYSETQPFFSLPRPRREAILQTGITFLEKMLGDYFPEIKKDANLLYVEFEVSY